VPSSDRAVPPLIADERATLAGWLDFYRATLGEKCHGLDDDGWRAASVPPSPLTLLGLVAHMAEVERNWFRRVLLGEDVPPIYDSPSSTPGHDGGFDLGDDVTGEKALVVWREEIERSRAACAGRDLDARSPFGEGEVTLRWIYAHMIGEYARHAGHADLIRERVDGVTGV
jgi:uncharacterized damage-inducible protein DinB